MTTDHRTLLEKCARVMGIDAVVDLGKGRIFDGFLRMNGDCVTGAWNPITSVADAAEIAIRCKVDVIWVDAGNGQGMAVNAFQGIKHKQTAYIKDHPTEQAAYCWAIVNVVAQMGGE